MSERTGAATGEPPSSGSTWAVAGAALAGALALAADDPRWLAVTGFCGLLGWCEALTRTRHGGWLSTLCGLAFGSAANAVALSSLVGLLTQFARWNTALALALSLLVWLLQGTPFALAGLASQRLRAAGYPAWLALPLTLTPAQAFVPQLFPWRVAATQVGFLPYVQLLELGGESLVGLLLVGAASALHASLRARGRDRRRALVVATLCSLVPLGYGLLRLPAVERQRQAAATLTIGVVQSNVGIEHKHDGQHLREIVRELRAATGLLERRGVDLTLWGETAYPYPLRRDSTHAPSDDRQLLGPDVRGPILLGLETYDDWAEDSPKYNSAWLVREDGRLGQRVDKARLLPFSEYMPLWGLLPKLHTRFRSGGFSAGEPGVVQVGADKLGVLICYEDLFAGSARATVALGARALVNLTNDAWFGDTREPLLHDLLARLRAIELRRDLVRAVNTGVSSFTSASGQSLIRTNTFERASFVAQVRLLDGRTPYAQWGDLTAPACLLACLVCWLRRAARLDQN